MHFTYSQSYIADIGLLVFPIEKYRLVAKALREAHDIPQSAFKFGCCSPRSGVRA